jgi:hypothetical protein
MATLWVCTVCHTADHPKTRTKGSFFIEIVLWICFIIPGVLYSLWRMTTRAKVCRSCGAEAIVPASSPAGRRIIDAA